MSMDPDDGDNNVSQQDVAILVMPKYGGTYLLLFSLLPSPFPVKYGEDPIQEQRSIAG